MNILRKCGFFVCLKTKQIETFNQLSRYIRVGILMSDQILRKKKYLFSLSLALWAQCGILNATVWIQEDKLYNISIYAIYIYIFINWYKIQQNKKTTTTTTHLFGIVSLFDRRILCNKQLNKIETTICHQFELQDLIYSTKNDNCNME